MSGDSLKKYANFVCLHALFSQTQSHSTVTIHQDCVFSNKSKEELLPPKFDGSTKASHVPYATYSCNPNFTQ